MHLLKWNGEHFFSTINFLLIVSFAVVDFAKAKRRRIVVDY